MRNRKKFFSAESKRRYSEKFLTGMVEMTINNLKRLADYERVQRLYKFEEEARAAGYKLIAGVDEAGRGSLVGPVTVAAVILPGNLYLEKLNDSKKISAHVREELFDKISDSALAKSVVQISAEEIDRLNIYQATLEGMKLAVRGLEVQPDFVLTDAMKVDFEGIDSRSIVHGDALSASIAAASIIAKVTRDRLADEWSKEYPVYGFEHNRGYGTQAHIAAIEKFGYCPLHRKSFNPVKSMIAGK